MWCYVSRRRFNLIRRDKILQLFLAQQVLKENKTNRFVFLKDSIVRLFRYFSLDKLLYFLDNKIYLLICNLSSFANIELLARYKTLQNQLFSDFEYFKIAGAFGALPLTPRGRSHHQVPYSSSMDPNYTGNANQVLLSNDLLKSVFLHF